MDRRVNMDALPPSVSMYALLRAWVQDDPYRQVPPDNPLIMMNDEEATRDHVDYENDDDDDLSSSPNTTVVSKPPAVIPVVLDRKRKWRESVVELKVELCSRGRQQRKRAQEKSFLRQRQARQSLQAMGINL